MLVSPAEHDPLLKSLGTVSQECERLGSDFLILSPNGLVGIQRKATVDLVASLRDRRLQRELVQMEALDHAILIVEGTWRWTTDYRDERTGYSLGEYRGLVLSLQMEHHIQVFETRDKPETAELLTHMEPWFSKKEHGSLLRVPKAKVDSRLHILQYFDGLSLTRAKAIFDHFGRVPLTWSCTKEEMSEVRCNGRRMPAKMIDNLWKVLQ